MSDLRGMGQTGRVGAYDISVLIRWFNNAAYAQLAQDSSRLVSQAMANNQSEFFGLLQTLSGLAASAAQTPDDVARAALDKKIMDVLSSLAQMTGSNEPFVVRTVGGGRRPLLDSVGLGLAALAGVAAVGTVVWAISRKPGVAS